MNKSDLIQILSQKENLTERMAIDIIDLIFDGFADELKKGAGSRSEGLETLSLGNTKPILGETRKPEKKLRSLLKGCLFSKWARS